MRKAEMVDIISDKTGIPKVDVMLTLETFFKETMNTVSKGNNLYVRGFGSFGKKTRKAKIGRIVKENKAIHIPEREVPYFKPSKKFYDLVDK